MRVSRGDGRWGRTMRLVAVGMLCGAPGVRLVAQSPTAQPPIGALDERTRATVLDSVRTVLRRSYVDADTARQIIEHLTKRQRAHAYDSITDRARFASMVSADVRALNGDKHLMLMNGNRGPRAALDPSDDRLVAMAKRANYGLRKVEVLDGNIGYLEVAGFLDAPGASEAIADALRFLERTSAIIIDVRRNGGGSGEMSHMLFSHFLGETPVPTIRVRDRRDNTDTIYRSVAVVPGPRRATVPLYVLTSNFSASAAEEFAFVLQHTGRATVVGERTAGAGHMNDIVEIGNGFQFSVSTTRVSHPSTGAEWERVGVTPQVVVEAPRALEKAIELARAAVSKP